MFYYIKQETLSRVAYLAAYPGRPGHQICKAGAQQSFKGRLGDFCTYYSYMRVSENRGP